MNVSNLFPILVCDFDYSEHNEFKQVFFENIEKYITPFEGGSQDESGIVNLHQHKELLPFYTYVATCAKDYVRELGVDPSEWAYHIVKSWWNANEKSNIPEHDHSDAHISFVYYLNVPKDSNQLIFLPQHYHPNDLTNGLFQENYADVSPILNRNKYNSSPAFEALEGNLIIFPGRLKHATISMSASQAMDPVTRDPNVLKQRRISISGDFLMTFKDPNNRRSLGLQPMSNWIRFV